MQLSLGQHTHKLPSTQHMQGLCVNLILADRILQFHSHSDDLGGRHRTQSNQSIFPGILSQFLRNIIIWGYQKSSWYSWKETS